MTEQNNFDALSNVTRQKPRKKTNKETKPAKAGFDPFNPLGETNKAFVKEGEAKSYKPGTDPNKTYYQNKAEEGNAVKEKQRGLDKYGKEFMSAAQKAAYPVATAETADKDFLFTPEYKTTQKLKSLEETAKKKVEDKASIRRLYDAEIRSDKTLTDLKKLMDESNALNDEEEIDLDNEFVGLDKSELAAERKKAADKLLRSGIEITDTAVDAEAENIWKSKRRKEKIYSKQYDFMEYLDGFDDNVSEVLKKYKLNDKAINDIQTAKSVTKADYIKQSIDDDYARFSKIQESLKPKDYKFTTQEEVDAENEKIQELTKIKDRTEKSLNMLGGLQAEYDSLADKSISLKDEVELFNKEWSWWGRTGLKTWNAFNIAGGGIAGAGAFVMDPFVYLFTGKENYFGNNVAEVVKSNAEFFSDMIPANREVSDLESLGEFVGSELLTQAPNTLVALATEGASMVAGFAGATTLGQEYSGMLEEEKYGYYDKDGNLKLPDYNPAQLFVAPIWAGASEAGTELAFGRMVGRAKNAVLNKASKEELEVFKKGLDNSYKAIGSRLVQNTAQNFAEEVPAELFNNMIQNYGDKLILNKDVDVLDNSLEVLKSTAAISTVFGTAPHVAIAAFKPFMPKSNILELQKNSEEILSLMENVDYNSLTKEEKRAIDTRIETINQKSNDIINKTTALFTANSSSDILDIYKRSKTLNEIRKEALVVQNSTSLDPIEKQKTIDVLNEKFKAENAIYESKLNNAYRTEQIHRKAVGDGILNKILSYGARQKAIEEAKKGEDVIKAANDMLESGSTIKSLSTEELIKDYESNPNNEKTINAIDKLIENKINDKTLSKDEVALYRKALISEKVRAYGQFYNNGNNIVLNNDAILKDKKFTTAKHEVLHRVAKSLSSNMENLGDALYTFVEENYSGEKDFKQTDFYKRTNAYKLKAERVLKDTENILEKLKGSFASGKIDSKEYNKAIAILKKKRAQAKNEAREEVLTLLVEGLETKEIVIDKAMDVRLDAEGNVIFDDAQDVFNFVVNYSNGYNKNQLTEEGRAVLTGKAKGILITKDNIPAIGIKESMNLQTLLDKYDGDARKMVNETLAKTASGNYTSSLTSSALGQELGGIIETITKRLYDPIPADNKEMLSRQEYKEALIGVAATMITNEYKADKQTLDQFVSNRLNLRANSLAKELGIEATQEQGGAGFKVEIDSNKTEGDDGMGFDDDFMSEEEADALIEQAEIDAAEEAAKSPKFVDTIDMNVEIDGKPLIETFNEKMQRNLSFALKRYDEEISKNRTITPFVETLRMEMQEDMYKSFKKLINNYSGGYAQFLTDKKEVLLANYTTTYLAKHPIFRKGIEKRVNGEWVAPSLIKKANGTIEYRWVDEKGNDLKIDRDNAAGRGLTSGPEFIRRNKKINDVLTTKEFVDYHFQDGGLRTKKKQNPEDAVARQLASETALEIFQQDVKEEGPLSKMFAERAELLGKIVSDNTLVEIAKDLDRGLIKESMQLQPVFDAFYAERFESDKYKNTLYDIFKAATSETGGLFSDEFFEKRQKAIEDGIDEFVVNEFIDRLFLENIHLIMRDQAIKTANKGVKYEIAIEKTIKQFFKGKIKSAIFDKKKGDITLEVNDKKYIIELKLNKNAQLSSMTLYDVFNKGKEVSTSKSTKNLSTINNILDKNSGIIKLINATYDYMVKKGIKIEKTKSGFKFKSKDNRNSFLNTIRQAGYKAIIEEGSGDIVVELYDSTGVDYMHIGAGVGIFALNKKSILENAPLFDAKLDYVLRLTPSGLDVTMRLFPKLKSGNEIDNALDLENPSKIKEFLEEVVNNEARIKESALIDEKFNQIIEETTGVEAYKEFSAIVGKRRGASKGKYRLFIPPGAEDFTGLLYDLMGKGKKGEEHKEFFMKHLVEPYTFGVNQIMRTKNAIRREYTQLMKVFPKVKSKLEKQIPSKDFTYDQAIRVYLWDKGGVEIPGLTQRDQIKLVDLIKNDPELEQFSGLLSQISRQPEGWLKPGNHWDVDTILSDLNNTTEGSNRKEFLSEFVENSKEMFSDKNKNKLRAVFGNNWVDAMEDALFRMTNGTNRVIGTNKVVNAWNNWVNNSTGAIMFFNRRSAILQLLSTFNYINWSDNNPLNAAAAFANQKQYWSDFAMIFNSPMMKERRGGLQMEVSEAEIANAAANSKNKAKAVMSYLLKIGFIPTQMADSFAIASGGASMYRNRVNTYLKEVDDQGNKKYNQKEAEDKAFEDFARTTNESQQSADPMLISQEQAGPLGRLVLAFQNTTQQYMRLSKKSLRDLINGRGDWKVHVSKIVYYTTIQNIIFNALQAGVFALIPGFGDEDDEEFDEKGKKLTAKEIAERKQKQQEEKEGDMLNGFVDGILRGAGLYGAIAATTKNVLLKYQEVEAKEKGMKDYTPVVLDAVSISPPIGSKVRKLNQAMKGRDYNREVIANRGYSVTYDGKLNLSPAWLATGQAVSAVTNFPMDRMYDETNSMIEAFDTRNTGLQRTALALGWKDWTVGATNEENDLIRSTAKKEKKDAKAKEEKSESNVRKRRIRKRKIRR